MPLLFIGLLYSECLGKLYSHKRGKYYTYFFEICEKYKKIYIIKILEKAIIENMLNLKELKDLNNNTTVLEKYQDDLKHVEKQFKNFNTEHKKYVALHAMGMMTGKELESFINNLNVRRSKNYRRKRKQFKNPPDCFGEHGGL